jgi:hypothetical protein
VASSSGRRDNADEKGVIGRDATRRSKPDGEIDAYGGEESAGPVFNTDGLAQNEYEGDTGSNVLRLEQGQRASSVEYEAGTSHGEVK